MFLYIDPLKQGLKQIYEGNRMEIIHVFIHRSIKTRIETIWIDLAVQAILVFLYIDPLKQGLKHIFIYFGNV